MGGFVNSISNNIDSVFAKNADFSGNANPSDVNGLQTNGQLWIGSLVLNPGGTHINVGTLTSPLGTLSIGYSSPNITLDLAGGATAIEKVNLQAGTTPIVPSGGAITFNGATVAAGTNPVQTNGTGANTMALQVQISQAIASTDATKIGLANFNSAQFSVDANGFVSSTITSAPVWQTITASQTLVKNNGYIAISPGGALSLALPSTASSTIGDIIWVTLDGATSWTITQAAGQQIRFSGSQTTVGVGGSLASTAQGDTIQLVYQGSGKFNVITGIGNLTVT